MTKTELINEIEKLESDNLCWFDETELNSMNIPFKTVSDLMENGILIYAPLDNIYVGKKTYRHLEY